MRCLQVALSKNEVGGGEELSQIHYGIFERFSLLPTTLVNLNEIQ